MKTQPFGFDHWSDCDVVFNNLYYALNPYNKNELPSLTLDDIEAIISDSVEFERTEFLKIQKNQKTTHHYHSDLLFKVLTVAFSEAFNKSAHKYYFVRYEFCKLEQLFIHYEEGDIPANEMYSTIIFKIKLTGCQIHKIRCALKDRFCFGNLTYDHIYPAPGPLARFNEKNIYVLTDSFGKFFYWLKDLFKLFEKNHIAICAAAHFNPETPGLEDYMNFIEAYYTANLYEIVQAAFVENCSFSNLHLVNTNTNEFHVVYMTKKIRELRMNIDATFRNTAQKKRSAFISPIYLKLIQILKKGQKRLSSTIDKTTINTDVAAYQLLESQISEIEEFYAGDIIKKVGITPSIINDEIKEINTVNSLMYTNWAKDGSAIRLLFLSMIYDKHIVQDTIYDDFKNAFSNKPVQNKIGLTLIKGMAYYFFKELKAKNKILDKDYWIGISLAFYLAEDENYDMTQLAHQKLPKAKTKTMIQIDTLINSI